jgi:hypothetical protein
MDYLFQFYLAMFLEKRKQTTVATTTLFKWYCVWVGGQVSHGLVASFRATFILEASLFCVPRACPGELCGLWAEHLSTHCRGFPFVQLDTANLQAWENPMRAPDSGRGSQNTDICTKDVEAQK